MAAGLTENFDAQNALKKITIFCRISLYKAFVLISKRLTLEYRHLTLCTVCAYDPKL